MIDLRTPVWREHADREIDLWLNADRLEDLGGDAFSYEGDYQYNFSSALDAACGYLDDDQLFQFPMKMSGTVDLVASRDGSINYVRYVLDTPPEGPLRGLVLASNVTDLKRTTNDRSATGASGLNAVLLCAANEFAYLLATYNELIQEWRSP